MKGREELEGDSSRFPSRLGTHNLSVLEHGVKKSCHIVALMRRCNRTTRAALMHTDIHRNGPPQL